MLEHVTQLSVEILKKCVVCEHKYAKEDIRLIRSGDGEAMVYAKCSSCESGAVWFIALQPFGGMVWSGMKTDLSLDELKKFDRAPAVSEDEVLGVYELLRAKEAGIPALIASFRHAPESELEAGR